MARLQEPPFVSISNLVLVRLMVAITAITVFMNILFLSPLGEPLTLNQWIVQSNLAQQQVQVEQALNSTLSDSSSSSSTNSNTFQVSFPHLSQTQGRQHILDLFQEAGVDLTPEMEANLPTWTQVQQVIGPHPYLLGLEHCADFRANVPPLERMLGSAGMFNTGTNLVTHLLKQNCEIPERRQLNGPHESKESYGMRWQVPWGKHTPAKFRKEHATTKAAKINKEWILPVVTIRNPYTWFGSMCKNGYTAKWDHGPRKCPNLRDNGADEDNWNSVTVKFAEGREDHHLSLAHLWNDWYSYYVQDADYPFVVIRMEDLVFYPKETTRAVCECAGGEIRTDQPFQFIVDSAKADSPGHDHSTGIYAAWIKYAKSPLPRYGFSQVDYESAMEALNGPLMESLGYHHPPAE